MSEDPYAGYRPVSAPRCVGGDPADHAALLDLYLEFRVTNDTLDNERLRGLWTDDADALFFNTNGYTYRGIEDWLPIWDHYRSRLELVRPGGSGDVRILVDGDLAVVIDDYMGRYWRWRGASEQPEFLEDQPYVRSTIVCRRDGARWRMVHGHFSSGRVGLRPEQRDGDDAD